MNFRLPLAVAALLFTHTALADQQLWISKPDAEKALALVNEAGSIRTFCAPCKETTSELVKVKRTDVERASDDDPNYWTLSVNGEGIDLAYAYAPVREGFWLWRKTKWRNIANMLSLHVEGVPEFLSESEMTDAK